MVKQDLVALVKEAQEILAGLRVENSFNVAVDFFRKIGEFPSTEEVKKLTPVPGHVGEQELFLAFLKDNGPRADGPNRTPEGKKTSLRDLYFSNNEETNPICLGSSHYIYSDGYMLSKYRRSVYSYLSKQAAFLNTASAIQWLG
jgi:hypothetical protein